MPESWEVVDLESLLRKPLRNGHSAKATTDPDGIRTLTLTAVTQRHFSVEVFAYPHMAHFFATVAGLAGQLLIKLRFLEPVLTVALEKIFNVVVE